MRTAFDKIAAGLNDAIAYQRSLDIPKHSQSDAMALSVISTAILIGIFALIS